MPALREGHPPTGFVSVAAVIRLLIEGFGVRPLRGDWAVILGAE